MTEELDQLLRNLKLHRMHAVYTEQLRAADQEQITYTDFVAGTDAEIGETFHRRTSKKTSSH